MTWGLPFSRSHNHDLLIKTYKTPPPLLFWRAGGGGGGRESNTVSCMVISNVFGCKSISIVTIQIFLSFFSLPNMTRSKTFL